jgi:hypothetical protein
VIGSTDLCVYHFKISHGFLGKISSVDHMIKKKKRVMMTIAFGWFQFLQKNIIFSCVNVKRKIFFHSICDSWLLFKFMPNIKFWIFFFLFWMLTFDVSWVESWNHSFQNSSGWIIKLFSEDYCIRSFFFCVLKNKFKFFWISFFFVILDFLMFDLLILKLNLKNKKILF